MTDLHTESKSRLLTLVFTDLVESVAFKNRVGEKQAERLIEEHHQLVVRLAEAANGREITALGDGYFLTFESSSMAVDFALRLMEAQATRADLPELRVGIHAGEVTESQVRRANRSLTDIGGVAVDIASRIQSLALPGQILMSRFAFDAARSRMRSDGLGGRVTWRAHGKYLFKGLEEPFEVFEAGIDGLSPLVPPPGSEKARRIPDSGSEDPSLDWRPARGMEIPHRNNWVLDEKLGGGAFGEVWLARQKKTRETRVLKFCHSIEHVRALKREVMLFRLLKESLGDRRDIARLLDWQFDESPYYLEMEHTGGVPLDQWLADPEGGAAVALDGRVALMASIADAVAAAHSVGVLHKDIKPSNILISTGSDGRAHPCLIDFGIGIITDAQFLEGHGITTTGLSDFSISSQGAPLTGTRNYLAPELLEGKPPTTLSDIYSLGVLLYQVVIGDCQRVLAPGWERDVGDELLAEDIAACVDGHPDRRLPSAPTLAEHLRTLDDRRRRLKEEREAREATRLSRIREERARVRLSIGRIITVSSVLLVAALGVIAWQNQVRARLEYELRREAEEAQRSAVKLRILADKATDEAMRQSRIALDALADAEHAGYRSSILAADAFVQDGRMRKARDILTLETPPRLRNWEWGKLLHDTFQDDMTLNLDRTVGRNMHAEFSPDGTRIVSGAYGGFVQVWDATSGCPLEQYQPHRDRVWTVRYTPDGQRLLTASFDKEATVFDPHTSSVVARFIGHTSFVRAIDINASGTLVATGCNDRTLRLWDARTGQLIKTVENPAAVYDLRFSPDGTRIVVASLDRTASIWDVATVSRIQTLTTETRTVLSARYSHDGMRIVASSSDGSVMIFDAASGAELARARGPGEYTHYADISPDGKYVVTTDDSGLLVLRRASDLAILGTAYGGTSQFKASFNNDGTRIVAASVWSLNVFDTNMLMTGGATDLTTDTAPAERAGLDGLRLVDFIEERDPAWQGRIRERSHITTGSATASIGKKTVWVDSYYDIHNPTRTQRIELDRDALSARVVDARTGTPLATLAPAGVHDACFSPDGRKAATVMLANEIVLWNTDNWTTAAVLRRPGQENWFARFAPDNRMLLAGYGRRETILWDTETMQPRHVMEGHIGAVPSGSFNTSGTRAVTVGRDHTAHIWDLESGRNIAVLRGHSERPSMALFTPDGLRVITCSLDHTVKVWDAETGHELLTAKEFVNSIDILGITLLGDSQTLAVVTSENRIHPIVAAPAIAGNDYEEILRETEVWRRHRNRGITVDPSCISW